MRAHKLQIWKNAKGFYWRLRGRNGKIIDGTTQPYTRYANARANLQANSLPGVAAAPTVWKRGAKAYSAVLGGKPGKFA